MEEISVYHKPGPFIYTVWNKKGKPLYVGGTEDVNAKSFKFDFPFADITGYYYDFPCWKDEVDRQIAKLKPAYNSRLHSSYTKVQILSYFRKVFHDARRKFGKAEKTMISDILVLECESFQFNGETYYSSFDRGYVFEIISEQYGIHSFKS